MKSEEQWLKIEDRVMAENKGQSNG